ncbi:MAG: hypothetical protein JSW25_04280 [Thermoplasmata archaeon]|nr:MAG: hypothetical protein JSW25_04280 [Thermoplasmata archaeon]
MQDRVLGMLIFVPVAIIVLLLLAMYLVDFLEEDPVNPVGSIPKIIMDHEGNETIVTVKAVGERRYDAMHINYTAGNETQNLSAFNRYVLDAGINHTIFVLNITVIRGNDHYLYNCSVSVELVEGEPVYFWIQEEGDEISERHRSPFKTLAEWREIK